ncbi:V-type ATP synthase subunit B [Microbacterium thalassium]|uniref:V-type ATP synthase beta chain n=1 Tax=Microbacterium thalassium TaxID=362649 RepID=A0A7X0KVB4_9MICO|nr:V-type ATP synthase subunit B [Microbacterium thalassium]MBB6392056.1 V/A-type H+-transporting ATPase subunit B [Microbacterium thalassium]GLK24985.1 V-type ATP synthase subunit B [Microbacterium thalassium]
MTTTEPEGLPASARRVEYRDVHALRGPLLVLGETADVGWDESAVVELDDGSVRHGVVLEVERDLVTLQVLEGTAGIEPGSVGVRFTGDPFAIPVGRGWLGRVCSGRGEPLDGGPPVVGETTVPVNGVPLNPVHREPPADPIRTGISAIDGLTTLVRGQKLPIFSVPGLSHLALATQIAAQARSEGRGFRVVFVAMGLTHADIDTVRDRLEERAASGELVLLLNAADDPVIERILAPRVALTIAEHLAYEEGDDVLVIMSDMTSYAEAVREVSAARREIPARRGYPGYLYSDLASIYERCGRVRGRDGSVTIVPVLTMPGGDITHPVPDLTGYITEGQVVLAPEVAARGVYPPVDTSSSLSRLMRAGAGPGRTREDHLPVAAQALASLSRSLRAAELAELMGADALGETDQAYLRYRDRFESAVLNQRENEDRSFGETLDRIWDALGVLPERELSMIPTALIERHRPSEGGAS